MLARLKSYYFWFRLRWCIWSIRLSRARNRLLYGRAAVARAIAEADQVMQPRRDAFRAMLREMDDRHERAVREGRARPMARRLSDHEWEV